jgi:hypothetical protein
VDVVGRYILNKPYSLVLHEPYPGLTSYCLQGSKYTPAKLPPEPIELWAYEV